MQEVGAGRIFEINFFSTTGVLPHLVYLRKTFFQIFTGMRGALSGMKAARERLPAPVKVHFSSYCNSEI
jgi:hypothetical protein